VPPGGAAVEMKIPLEQALEEVRPLLFGSACATPTPEQWDTIFLWQNAERVPRQMVKKLQRALLIRERLDRQLHEADKWLRLHVENYDVVVVHSTNAEAPAGGLTGGQMNWKADIKPISIDSEALQEALQREFGETPGRPLSAPNVENLLVQYFKETNRKPSQDDAIKYVKAKASGRKFDRDGARDSYKRLVGQPVLKRGRPSS
jgi:hypothetical protein